MNQTITVNNTNFKKVKDVVKQYGVENVFFISKVLPLRRVMFLSYTSSSDEPINMLCKIDETRYKVSDGYKITLKPMHEGFATEHYYQSDLESIIKQGKIELLIKIS